MKIIMVALYLSIALPVVIASRMPWYLAFIFCGGIVSITCMFDIYKSRIDNLEREIRLLKHYHFHLEDKLSKGFFWPTGAINNLDFKGEGI